MMGMDLELFKKESRPTAEKEIKADLAFEAIAKTEDFEITDEAIEDEYKKMADNYHVEIDAIKKAVDVDSIKTGLKIQAARDLVFSSAVVEKKEKKSDDKPSNDDGAKGEEAEAEEKN